MISIRLSILLAVGFILSACASAPPQPPRIGELQGKPLEVPPPQPVDADATTALATYRSFLQDADDGPAYREALRRSADVELENAEQIKTPPHADRPRPSPQAAIRLYQEYLAKYPGDANNERILYQLAKAYDLDGQLEKSLATLARLLDQYPRGQYEEEALFRSGEMHFSLRQQAAAEAAFKHIIHDYPHSIYFQRSLYMLGWSLYLQNRFGEAVQTFFSLLDHKLDGDALAGDALSADLSPADRELLDDSLKAICLALSYEGISDPVAVNFDRHGERPYEALVYRRLGEFYLEKQRYLDAAHTFLDMPRRHPDHSLAPEFQHYAIEAYENGGFVNLFFAAKATFVKNYGLGSPYWLSHDDEVQRRIRRYLAVDIKDLATHFHGLARRGHATADFTEAVAWYREYLRTFTAGNAAAEMNFMLAECLHDARRYMEAVAEYEKSAYDYDSHKHGNEAGYAALLTYKEILPQLADNERQQWQRKAIASALRFSERFPHDKRTDQVLANITDELYAMHDYPGTIDAAQRLLQRPRQQNDDLRRKAWIVLGHAWFETADYADAQTAYQAALVLLPDDTPQRTKIVANLAASMYKQGEQRRAAGDLKGAIAIFMRIEQTAPAPAIWVAAEYDASAALIELHDWTGAKTILEDFHRRKLGDRKLQHGVSEKLALVYMKTGQKWKAAHEMEALAASPADQAKHRELLWEAAALYRETGADYDAIRLYKRFLDEFPRAFADGIEARHNLSLLYTRLGKTDTARAWRKELIEADRTAGAARTDRSRQLAGEATLALAQPLLQAYQDARLTLPLKTSLKIKKARMKKAIAMYRKALEYQVAEVSTAATYRLAGIYDHFAKALLASDRPPGLSKDELEQYNILLEDQSYSFQDKAIQVYEANVKHIPDGVYDKWIKDSLNALAVLYPVRYAKTEQSEAYFDAAP